MYSAFMEAHALLTKVFRTMLLLWRLLQGLGIHADVDLSVIEKFGIFLKTDSRQLTETEGFLPTPGE
uniref:Uncharacterized protein n=1 Tax=Lepeophtheirus salmonis TaxID=72036 RepID=A0A0K2V160_LEPSM